MATYAFDDNLNRIEVKDKSAQEAVDSEQNSRLTTLENNLNAAQGKISAGSGLTLDGDTIKHVASITAGSKGSSTAIPVITYNDTGHITSITAATVYPPTSVGSSAQIWAGDGSGTGAWKDALYPSYMFKDPGDTIYFKNETPVPYLFSIYYNGSKAGTTWVSVYANLTASGDIVHEQANYGYKGLRTCTSMVPPGYSARGRSGDGSLSDGTVWACPIVTSGLVLNNASAIPSGAPFWN